MSDWIVDLVRQSGYLGVAFLMFLETMFPPIPSEVIMPIAGVEAGKGNLNIYGVIASGTAGAMLGNILWYLMARVLGIIRLKPFVDRYGRWLTMDWAEVERAQKWFDRTGLFFVFIGRMLPTVRSLVSVPAGLLKMRFRSFFIASTIGTAGWTAILAVAGFQLGQNYGEIDEIIGPASTAILVIMAAGYVWRVIRWKPAAERG